MKIKIINPNTSQSMTDSVARLARRVARPDTQVSQIFDVALRSSDW